MYASRFEYAAASSWDEAVSLLAESEVETRVIAGGQSLVPMMTLRLATPRLLVDVNRASSAPIEELDGQLRIPALTRHAELERSALVLRTCPILSEAAGLIGNIRVRHRGTIGGSVAHADPAAELPCVVLALQGVIRVLGPAGERAIAAGDFFISHYTSALEPGEVVTGVDVSVIPEGRGWAFVELARRTGDFALVEAAALVDIQKAGLRCSAVRIVVGAVDEKPLDLSNVALAMVGTQPDDRVMAEVAAEVARAVEPSSSVHGSAAYRRDMVGVVVKRALAVAIHRAVEMGQG